MAHSVQAELLSGFSADVPVSERNRIINSNNLFLWHLQSTVKYVRPILGIFLFRKNYMGLTFFVWVLRNFEGSESCPSACSPRQLFSVT
jgi:hypothetical protein